MANYATHTDVSDIEYAATGETFSVAMQAIVLKNLNTAHGIIIGYLGMEPTVTAELTNIEAQLCVNIRKLSKDQDSPIADPFTPALRQRLDNLHKIPDSTEEEICGTINMRGWPNY